MNDPAITTLFETERLILRPTSVEDAALILELLNTPKWLKFIGDRHVRTLEDAKNYILERILPQQNRLGFGSFTIIRKEDHNKLGTCGLFDREGLEGIDLGYGLLPQNEGKGYGFEAANQLKQLAFKTFKLKEIHAITVNENVASKGLLLKLGFTPQGTTKLPDDDTVLLLYSLRKTP
ncbi:GNAT family N-acetyltransferase [Gaetbulibacter aestuarii]|uniref:GNAT family N-acetyltransferase n=1 Tax=Gaetbulibacter aestuarii TaxID=1502358 RepID=A0ABW7MY70_9FLAO